jgi:DNA mismatch repair ATPase MutS
MFNPEIKNNLEKENEEYQKIDFLCEEGVTLITGANMTGKTVILKTLALIQNMMQYGFYVPAEYASLPITDEIFMLSGDLQSIQSGLSSFAAEILFVNKIYKHSKTNKKSLILMDELARNTNPHEGKAIVKAMISLLKNKNSFSIITSHYEGVNSYEKNIKNYRVKGLKKDKTTEITGSYKHIAKFIDYSLVEFKQGEKIPEEALTIAKILDIDEDIIKKAKYYLGN